VTFFLEVAIGLVLLYTILSLFCTAINEWIARWLKLRSKTLKTGIEDLLGGPDAQNLALAFHHHPLITGLCFKRDYAAYIPPTTFALALLDTAFSKDTLGAYYVDPAKVDPQLNPNGKGPRDLLTAIVRGAEGDADKIVARLSTWFDDSMDRVSGVYRRNTQVIIYFVGLSLAIALHADSIGIVKRLQRDSVLRTTLSNQAAAVVKQPIDSLKWQTEYDKLEAAHVPLGWTCNPLKGECQVNLVTAFGIFLTSIALALGAPFWFDTLNKLANLRQSGLPPDEKAAKK
jgi:hypothetical protein